MYFSQFALSIDPQALGRVDYATLSQQAMMEVLTADFAPEWTHIRDEDGNYDDIQAWDGVTCNGEGDVTAIRWVSAFQFIGIDLAPDSADSLDVRWVPPTLQEIEIAKYRVVNFAPAHIPAATHSVRMDKCLISASIDTAALPRAMTHLALTRNKLRGGIDCENLPPTIDHLDLHQNALTGTIDLQKIPATLEILDLSTNQLTGSLDLTNLSQNTKLLSLHSNLFTAASDLPGCAYREANAHHGSQRGTHILIHSNTIGGVLQLSTEISTPAGMPQVFCIKNRFRSIAWESFSKITFVDVCDNRLEGSLDIGAVPESVQILYLSDNILGGSLQLERLRRGVVYVRLDRNCFTGPVRLDALPRSLQQIDLSENALTGAIRFGDKIPSSVFLSANKFSSIEFKPAQFRRPFRTFIAANNEIAQDVVTLGEIGAEMYIDLHGNDIGSCAMADGSPVTSRDVCYDNGTDEQRWQSFSTTAKPVTWPMCR